MTSVKYRISGFVDYITMPRVADFIQRFVQRSRGGGKFFPPPRTYIIIIKIYKKKIILIKRGINTITWSKLIMNIMVIVIFLKVLKRKMVFIMIKRVWMWVYGFVFNVLFIGVKEVCH